MTGEPGTVRERILAAQERMEKGQAWFRRFASLNWEDVYDFIGACVRNEGDQDMLFSYVRDHENDGTPSPAALPDLKDKLRKCFRRSFETDALSAMGAIVVPNEDQAFSWKVFEGHPLIANYTEGEFGRVSGPPGGGKTNVGCVIIEQWTAQGNLIFSNIANLEEVQGHRFTATAKALIRAAVDAARGGVQWIWVLDEGGAAGYTNAEWMTVRSRDLNKFIRIIRKLRGNMLYIEQDPRAAPRLIVDWARNLYHCPFKGAVSIDLRGPHLVWRQDVRDFPKTELPFDSRDVAAFKVDVDVDAMFQAIGGRKDQLDAMIEYIDTPLKVPEPDQEQPRSPKTGHFLSRRHSMTKAATAAVDIPTKTPF